MEYIPASCITRCQNYFVVLICGHFFLVPDKISLVANGFRTTTRMTIENGSRSHTEVAQTTMDGEISGIAYLKNTYCQA